MKQPTPLSIIAADGFRLSATFYEAQVPNGKVVLVGSAMGVKQHYYADFASFLSEQGFAVYTFDYRGMGASMPESKSLRGFQVHLHEWATKDMEAMVQYILKAHQGQELQFVGHSVAGQVLGWLPSYAAIKKALLVASQCGYWGDWSGTGKAKIWTLWHLAIPPLSHLFGYFPSKKMGLFDNLPKGVALEWAKWGRHRDYVFGYANAKNSHYHELAIPMLFYSFSDDFYAPRLSTEKLVQGYSASQSKHIHLQPKDIGHRHIGHFGFFRDTYKESLWQPALAFLE